MSIILPMTYTTIISRVKEGTLHDQSNAIPDSDLYTSYSVVQEGPTTVSNSAYNATFKVSARGLRQHENANNTIGYWVGISIPYTPIGEDGISADLTWNNRSSTPIPSSYKEWEDEETHVWYTTYYYDCNESMTQDTITYVYKKSGTPIATVTYTVKFDVTTVSAN